MADSKKESQSYEEQKEPYVSQEDRPEVKLKPDTPMSELRVRDLVHILGFAIAKPGISKSEAETSPPSLWNPWLKTGLSKSEADGPAVGIKYFKEVKYEKWEIDERHHWPKVFPEPDPRVEHVIHVLAGLTSQVSQLADQVAALQKQLPR
ncbi:MAG TPA: hypothetical protein VEX68_18220 [Bryobacteraceae bacterium]|nr:hypothetical protein [Bryobacteraceae bacterium]